MRDYSMDDRRAMAGDLSEIQKLWQTILAWISANNMKLSLSSKDREKLAEKNSYLEVPNFVFVMQKELAMSDDGMVTHFFLGKARVIEISPFSPGELVEYYKKEFGSTYPFKGESDLALLARVSRGIFRRFLRYIKLSLEACVLQKEGQQTSISIDSDMITKALDSEEIHMDWKMDLSRVFSSNPKQTKAASDIVLALMDRNPIPQSIISKVLWEKKKKENRISSAEASRILSKLEQYGYIRRKREGNEKLVYVNF